MLVRLSGTEAKTARNHKLRLNFEVRPPRMTEKLKILSFRCPPITLRYIAGYGNRSSP
jgi:hypothetical protein